MHDSDYMFGHDRHEYERLMRQAEMLKPITQRLLVSAGVESGMRVLDIGCGPGDVTMLAAEHVGPTGQVVGIDRDEGVIDTARRRIRQRGFTNVSFALHDVETFDGPADFDVAVCRYVLIHQADPGRFLQATKRLVRPGGIVAMHEMDPTAGITSTPPLPLLRQMSALLIATFERMDTARDAGARLVPMFAAAGLPAPHLFGETIVESGGDSMLLPWVTDVVRQLLPRIVASGDVTEDEIQIDTLTERLRRAAVENRSQIVSVPQFCCWARV